MDTTTLADILAYRLRGHLGADVDYRANLLPNELAFAVEMRQPEYLRGLHFIFREDEPLPEPIRNVRNATVPNIGLEVNLMDQAMMYNVPANWPWTINGANPTTITRETGMRVRTEEEQVFYQGIETLNNQALPINPDDWGRYTHLLATTTARVMPVTVPLAPPVIVTRTPEQEARFQDLYDRDTNGEIFEGATLREWNNLLNLPTCPTPLAPRIRVRVSRDTGGNWQVSVRIGTAANKELPSISVIKSLLNPADKHFLPSRQGRYRSTITILRNSLTAGLPAQSLHDALRAWIMATENQVTLAESSMPANGIDAVTANLLRAQPATLEVGGLVYKLVPCHQTDVRPLIARVRAKALAGANVEATAITERAQTDARVTVSEAERRAQVVKAEAETLLRRQGARMPDWVRDNHRAAYFERGKWYVRFYVGCKVRDIRLYVRLWNLVLHWTPLPQVNPKAMPLWVGLGEGGEISIGSIYAKEFNCTHIGDGGCMTLQNFPRVIKGEAEMEALVNAITSGMQVINLNSPLRVDIREYWPAFREQIPPPVIQWLKDKHEGNRYLTEETGIRTPDLFLAQYPRYKWDKAETLAQEESGTFTTAMPVVPVASPVVIEELAQMIQQAQAITLTPELNRAVEVLTRTRRT